MGVPLAYLYLPAMKLEAVIQVRLDSCEFHGDLSTAAGSLRCSYCLQREKFEYPIFTLFRSLFAVDITRTKNNLKQFAFRFSTQTKCSRNSMNKNYCFYFNKWAQSCDIMSRLPNNFVMKHIIKDSISFYLDR